MAPTRAAPIRHAKAAGMIVCSIAHSDASGTGGSAIGLSATDRLRGGQ